MISLIFKDFYGISEINSKISEIFRSFGNYRISTFQEFNVVSKGQFPVSGIFRAGRILDNKKLLSSNYLFNFRATFSLANKRISASSENSTDWKSALTVLHIYFPA